MMKMSLPGHVLHMQQQNSTQMPVEISTLGASTPDLVKNHPKKGHLIVKPASSFNFQVPKPWND